ncbi:tRNA uridine-5-carboxymethylaminomethyl(34) synthesis GTPase MnmE [Porticoccaceae bacterium]|nr:tRNA uridine-5-carboxymethylaminomethyl(34) synthesis GTPase MnmE [Porticoccaceae bacterium]
MTAQAHSLANNRDTIVAIATAPGRGGIGIVRLSGTDLDPFIQGILGAKKSLQSRQATYSSFIDDSGDVIDEGVAVYFPGPNSFTGETVLELQGHGGQVVLDRLVQRCIELGARLARPGEFSERAFLNDKMDLAQAEAVADLIDASSYQAARSAIKSLQGEFSTLVTQLVETMIQLRIYVEAAIDFPEEEIDFLADENLRANLRNLQAELRQIMSRAEQGSLLREGMTLVLAGKPNAGKSSLLNALAGTDTAIVTPVAGTTRDVLREKISLGGLPLNIVDTAGLRETSDEVEIEGVRRAWSEIEKADLILFVVDITETDSPDLHEIWPEYFIRFPEARQPLILVLNKIDRCDQQPGAVEGRESCFALSAKQKQGIAQLTAHLQQVAGYQDQAEGVFSARRRHLEALARALELVSTGIQQLEETGAGELLAEDLRQAQNNLCEITGQFTSDDLLGRIFSSFCIGK